MSDVCGERRVCRLDDLGFVGRGRSRHRPRNDPSLYGGPYPFFQTGDIKAAELRLKHYSQTYNEEGLAQSKLWDPGTLCITIAANIAETAILGVRGCFPDSVVGFIADPHKADTRFIKYYIDYTKYQMQDISHGTTQDNLSLEKLLSLDFVVPNVKVQRKVAAILSAYDDLIENNRRRIEILEEMAQALYREWFVEFRFPGHEDVRMVDSPLGKIPEGWEVQKFETAVELAYGKGLRKQDRVAGTSPVYGSSGIIDYHNEPLVQGPGIIVGRKGNVGSVFWSDDDFYPIDTVFYAVTDLPLRYVFFSLRRMNFINNDAAVPGLSRRQAYALPFLVPSWGLLDQFDCITKPIFSLQRVLTEKNLALGRAREQLLPRLISGELDLSELCVDMEGLK